METNHVWPRWTVMLLATFLLVSSPPAETAPSTGHIYVADRGNSRIVRMNDISGAGWIMLGTSGSGVKQFNFPRGLFVDTAGRIYVADTENHRIVRMNDMSGTGWTAIGSAGAGPKQFNKPRGVFVDGSGKIYVTDSGNHRTVRMGDMSGADWTTFGAFSGGSSKDKPGNLIDPAGIFVDVAGRIYIADIGSGYDLRRIVRIDDITGSNWTPFGVWGKAVNRFDSPSSIVVDSTGKIYVADTANHRIVRISDMAGTGWLTLGTQGSAAKQFNLPSGLAVDAAGRGLRPRAADGRDRRHPGARGLDRSARGRRSPIRLGRGDGDTARRRRAPCTGSGPTRRPRAPD